MNEIVLRVDQTDNLKYQSPKIMEEPLICLTRQQSVLYSYVPLLAN
jgi:hypothetical protein